MARYAPCSNWKSASLSKSIVNFTRKGKQLLKRLTIRAYEVPYGFLKTAVELY